jgi:N-acetyl-1-D-myo-inositol-2-amino-2-deoxy-alpha-D-glucopyranoside deacetylase
MGVEVTLLTCTLGEEGEILVPELAQLAAAQADQLGGYRIGELDAATTVLGVRDHRFLGGAGRFRDSGMLGTPANDHPRAFWRAAADHEVFDAAVRAAVEVVRDVRPHVVVTYDEDGDYGHPDHVMAHRVTMAAVAGAADPADGGGSNGRAWQVAKVYWVVTPKSVLRAGLAAAAREPGLPFDIAADLPFGVPDEAVSAAVDARDQLPAKLRAMAAHRTQLSVHGSFFALTNRLGREVSAVEYFRLVHGAAGAERDPAGRETDLFAGIGSAA